MSYGQVKYPIEDVQPLDKPLTKKGNIVQVRFKFSKIPPVFVVTSDSKRLLDFSVVQQNGYTVLTVTPDGSDEIFVFTGKAKTGNFQGLAKFYVD